jgi:hypothetical protein
LEANISHDDEDEEYEEEDVVPIYMIRVRLSIVLFAKIKLIALTLLISCLSL